MSLQNKEWKSNNNLDKSVPPDGAWGWVVVFGAGLVNIVHISMVSIFGLLYAPEIRKMGYGVRGATLVPSLCMFIQNVFGPFTGSIIKTTSYRKTSILGNILCSLGMIASAFSTEFWHLIVSFGIIRGFGMSMLLASNYVAVDAYFKKNKGQAVGVSFYGLSIGLMIWPYITQYFLSEYNFQGATLLISGLGLNGFVGSFLMQPVKLHMVNPKGKMLLDKHEEANAPNEIKSEQKEAVPLIVNSEVIKEDEKDFQVNSHKQMKTSVITNFIKFLDLDLLRNYHFVLVVISSSLAFASAMCFVVILPILLMDIFKNDSQSTSFILSVMAVSEIVGLTLVPIVMKKLKIKPFEIIIIASVFLTAVRQVYTFNVSYTSIIIASILNGIWKTSIIVYQNIAVTSKCTPEQVPSALGIVMLAKGFILLPTGYLVGWIKDYTGSYVYSITALNVMSIIVISTWLVPTLYNKWKVHK